jgi:hypothetical protein
MRASIALVVVMFVTVAACDTESGTTPEADPTTTAEVPARSDVTTTGAGSAPGSTFDVVATCTSSAPTGYQFFSAEATTVGAVRDLRAGPMTTDGDPAQMWPDAFPDAASSDPAGWCIAVDASATYAFYAVTPGQPTLDIGNQSGLPEPPPPGPPRIE